MNSATKEYAEALFLLGKEENELEEILASLETVKTVVEENPQYIEFLSSPAVVKSERLEAIDQAFNEKINENVISFIKLLIENDKIKGLLEVIDEVKFLYNQSFLKTYAKIISAISLSEKQKTAILNKLEKVTKREIEPTFLVDNSIIGGIRIEVDGKVYDGSIKHTLDDVKDVITR